jgi:heme exporter protein A
MAIRHTDAAVDFARSRGPSAAAAVSRISFQVERGETVFVRGPNGTGKGEVLGFDLLGGRDEIRRRTELVSHRTRLYEDLSALENLRFAAVIHGASIPRVPRRHWARSAWRMWPGSACQRLALARATPRAPELFLLDEPYAGLDGQAKELVDQLALGAQRDGRTVLVVTHDATRTHLATRMVVRRAGRLYSPAPVVDAEAARPLPSRCMR